MARAKIADISFWEKGLLLKNLKTHGYNSVIAKASQRRTDECFENFYDQALENSMFFGAFHYLDLDYNISAQADLFLTLTEAKRIDFPLIADLEMEGTNAAAKSKAFIDLLVQAGRKVMIYTCPGYWAYLGKPAWGALYPLWIAHYTWPIPTTPSPWKKWDIWQYSSKGTIPEQPKIYFDDNYFNGDDSALELWLSGVYQPSLEERVTHLERVAKNHEARISELEKV